MKKFSKKKILKAQTADSRVDFIPPVAAKAFVPEWYKTTPAIVEGQMSIKRCVPVLDSFLTGYMITTSADFIFDESQQRFIDNAAWKEPISTHMDFQVENMDLDDSIYPHPYKWNNSWMLQAPEGYSLLITHPLNRFDLPFQSITGVVDADMHPLVINFPFFMKKGFSGLIPKGTPIVQVIPIKREPWELKVDDENTHEYKDFWRWNIHPEATYKRKFWERKEYS